MKAAAQVGAMLAVVIPLSASVWWLADHTARADSQEQEQRTLVRAVEKLTDIHVRQATVEEAERDLIRKLCAEKKLPASECTE